MIQYIPYSDFKKLYPLSSLPFKEGVYGKIFVIGNCVVKKFSPDYQLREMTIELNMYAINVHPCIIKPLGWSSGDDFAGYIIMEKGIDICEAYLQNLITIEDIISDTLSAIAFMNLQGIFHGDIKPANMIFHEGKCKMIDLGLSRKGILHNDKSWYIIDILYTENYRDPEYHHNQYNNIKCEIYSLAASYMHILNSNPPLYGALYTFEPDNLMLKDFVQQAKVLQCKRSSIDTILHNTCVTRSYEAKISYRDTIFSFVDLDTINYVYKIVKHKNIKVYTLFLAIALMHYSKLAKTKIFGAVCLNLAICVCFEGFLEWKEFEGEDFGTMTINLLNECKCHISLLTAWDYAHCGTHLLTLLKDMVSPTYNPLKIRTFPCSFNKNKYITVNLMKSIACESTEEEYNLVKEIFPCNFNIRSDLQYVEKIWSKSKNPYELISVLMRNRDVLYLLNEKVAKIIFFRLKKIKTCIQYETFLQIPYSTV